MFTPNPTAALRKMRAQKVLNSGPATRWAQAGVARLRNYPTLAQSISTGQRHQIAVLPDWRNRNCRNGLVELE